MVQGGAADAQYPRSKIRNWGGKSTPALASGHSPEASGAIVSADVAAAGSQKRNTTALRENEGWNRGESNQVKPFEDVETAMVKPRPDVESVAAAGGDTRAPGSGRATGDRAHRAGRICRA